MSILLSAQKILSVLVNLDKELRNIELNQAKKSMLDIINFLEDSKKSKADTFQENTSQYLQLNDINNANLKMISKKAKDDMSIKSKSKINGCRK